MFGNLMGKLQEVQQKAEEAKALLAAGRFEGKSADGRVLAIVDGNSRLIDIIIDPTCLSGNADDIQSLVKEAVVGAQQEASAAQAETMKNAAKSFLPGFPG